MVLGADGYLGFPMCIHLKRQGHEVLGIDSYAKRSWERECNVRPLWKLDYAENRLKRENTGFEACDILTRPFDRAVERFLPEAIVHFAEQPSAPYSMAGSAKACETQRNNVLGTLTLMFSVMRHCPDAHIVKLGTMGEYGTPKIDIEEGWLDVEHNGRHDRVLYPKRPGSFYHLSKVHDSANLEFGARVWGLRVTDLNQGIVYGTRPQAEGNRGQPVSFHYDAVFGTALNRFITQAVAGSDLTVYGAGGQTRGWINIRDTMKCVELACLHPAVKGEFRVFNQFTEQFSVLELAQKVSNLTGAHIAHVDNPRIEAEIHYYNAKHTALEGLGLVPTKLTDEVLGEMIADVETARMSIDRRMFEPTIRWKGGG